MKRVYKLQGKPVSQEQYLRWQKELIEKAKKKDDNLSKEAREKRVQYMASHGLLKKED